MFTAAAAVVFGVVAIVALVAGWVARKQTRLAEANFAVARQTVRDTVFNVAQGLRDVSGMRVEALQRSSRPFGRGATSSSPPRPTTPIFSARAQPCS